MLLLDLARCSIDDEQGKYLISYLRKNNTLRSLYLEGNVLGPKSAMELGQTLKVNTGLKLLDLEGNQLVGGDANDQIGLYEFVEFLDSNTTLLSLNIANNLLDAKIGELFKQKLQNNSTIISINFTMNFFNMHDSQDIQEMLNANKAAYDAERKAEWLERRAMKGEDTALRRMMLGDNAEKAQQQMEDDAREIREMDLNAKWERRLLETAIEKQHLIEQLTEAALIRGTKKKKKGKGKGKK